MPRFLIAAAAFLLIAATVSAQVTPAAGYTPPDDTPTFKVGAQTQLMPTDWKVEGGNLRLQFAPKSGN